MTQLAQVLAFPGPRTPPPSAGVAEFAFLARYAVALVVDDRAQDQAIPADVNDALEVILDWLVQQPEGAS